MATQGKEPRRGSASGEPASVIAVGELDGGAARETPLPEYVRRTLRSSVGAHPERRAVRLTPVPDPRVVRRLRQSEVSERALRVRSTFDDARAGRSAERLIEAFADHSHLDLELPAGRAEAMAQALGYQFWFGRRFATVGPLELSSDSVRSCWGNFYIRRPGPARPELSWIHFALQGVGVFTAMMVRAGWWDLPTAKPLLGLADDGEWFVERLRTYWTAQGEAWHEWRDMYDPERL